MARSPVSLVPSDAGQPAAEKRDDKASTCRQEGEANARAATKVNAVSASSTQPAIRPIQLELFPGRACPLKAKPETDRRQASTGAVCRDGVQGGGTRVVGRFPNETSALTLIWAGIEQDRLKWRGVKIDSEIAEEIAQVAEALQAEPIAAPFADNYLKAA